MGRGQRAVVAAEVGHLLLGERRIEVPGHGMLIVAWKSRSTGSGGLRALIVAVGRDGSELSRIGPHDSLDSYTWANMSSQQELTRRTAGQTAGGLTIRRLPWVQTWGLTSGRARTQGEDCQRSGHGNGRGHEHRHVPA